MRLVGTWLVLEADTSSPDTRLELPRSWKSCFMALIRAVIAVVTSTLLVIALVAGIPKDVTLTEHG